jgi:hypothetical protein
MFCKAVAEGRSHQEKEGVVYAMGARGVHFPMHARDGKAQIGEGERERERARARERRCWEREMR